MMTIDQGPYGDEIDVTLEEIAEEFNTTVEHIRSLVNHERECLQCGYTWTYTGDADRPTCPDCKGKRTQPVGAQE